MNELQVKTIEMKPAVIEFNHENIEKELQENLKKYEGLTFTSEASTELRSTLAELRKGKKAVDEYRKKIKRELNQPVLKFEEKCKSLNKYFDEVIVPLDKQLKTFVEQERAEKLEKLEIARDEYIKKHELHDDYVDRIEIEDRFLTKSVSLKSASESIEFQVKNLKMEQDKLGADKEVISTTVKLANAENELSFSADAYIRLLEFDDVETVRIQINKDVEKELGRRAEKERKEQEKLEQERIREKEKENFDKSMEEVKDIALEQTTTNIEDIEKENEEIIGVPFDDVKEMDNPFESMQIIQEINITINCTDDQFDKLTHFMRENDIDWDVN